MTRRGWLTALAGATGAGKLAASKSKQINTPPPGRHDAPILVVEAGRIFESRKATIDGVEVGNRCYRFEGYSNGAARAYCYVHGADSKPIIIGDDLRREVIEGRGEFLGVIGGDRVLQALHFREGRVLEGPRIMQ